jgi:TonB family protein
MRSSMATLGLREARTAQRKGFTPSRKGSNDTALYGVPENKCDLLLSYTLVAAPAKTKDGSMLRPRILSGSTVLLLISIAAAIAPTLSSAQEQTPTTPAPTDTPIRKPGRMDLKHPLHIGSDYYPKQSLKAHEQGRCHVAFLIEANGSVSAMQMLSASGFPRLDTACIESVLNVPMTPATVNGTPVTAWSDFNLVWVIDAAQPYHPLPERTAYPRVADDFEFQAGAKFYPEAARAKHPSGYCVVNATVSSGGTALNSTITRSAGSPILDAACLTAVNTARFTPELQDGRPVPDSTDIAIYW